MIVADATNFGPTGLERDRDVFEREGDVLCYLGNSGNDFEARREHFVGDEETQFYVLNVECGVYPSEVRRAEAQLARVERAMPDLATSVRAEG